MQMVNINARHRLVIWAGGDAWITAPSCSLECSSDEVAARSKGSLEYSFGELDMLKNRSSEEKAK